MAIGVADSIFLVLWQIHLDIFLYPVRKVGVDEIEKKG
jgi:hypothetical protein